MEHNLWDRATKALLDQKRRKRWLKVVSVLGCLVVFCTTYALILPAITLENKEICGYEEHTHVESCYVTETVPGELQLDCDISAIGVHTHEDSCYDENHAAICGYADYVVHTHVSACYEAGVLVCPLSELKEHAHTSACYTESQKRICGLEEEENPHLHTDACYTQEQSLVCELEEEEGVHTHTDECYTINNVLSCGLEETPDPHTHDDSCYETITTLSCTKPEIVLHTHTDSCFTTSGGSKTLTCTQVEVLAHAHSDACFTVKTVQAIGCGLEEHTHNDECYEDVNDALATDPTTDGTDEITDSTTDGAEATDASTEPAAQSDGNDGIALMSEDDTAETNGNDGIAVASVDTVVASGTAGDNITWELTGTSGNYTLTLTGSGAMYDYEQYGNDSPWDDYCSSIKSLRIGDGITSIGNYAFFYHYNLTSVTIPNSVTSIGDSSFYLCYNSLASVTIPDSVISIGNHAFGGCYALTSITIPENVTSIGDSAFSSCRGLTSVTIPKNVTSLGSEVFSNCTGLTSVTISDGVSSIGSSAFYNCTGLTNVEIPESVASIESSTFYGCSALVSVTIPDSVTSIGDRAFSGCTSLTSVVIPDGVTSIGNSTFSDCTGLTSVTIPENVTSIGDYAFSNCTGLTSVTIPESVSSIGDAAFRNCTGLSSVMLPVGYYAIGTDAFSECTVTPLNSLGAGVYYIDANQVYYGVTDGKAYVAYCPEGVTDLLTELPGEDGSEGAYPVVTSGETYIAGGVEGNITWSIIEKDGDQTLTLSGTGEMNEYYKHTHLPWYSYISAVKYLEIKDGITNICDYAFYDGSALTSVTIPSSVTSIGIYAFNGCSGLTSVTIPNGVTSIGNYAFNGCSGLASVTFPSGYFTMGDSPFSGCTSLGSLSSVGRGTYYVDGNQVLYGLAGEKGYVSYCPEGVETLLEYLPSEDGTDPYAYPVITDTSYVAGGTYENTTWLITEKDGERTLLLTGAGDMVGSKPYNLPWYEYRSTIQHVDIGDEITHIGDYAFCEFTSLTSVTIPDNVTSIGYGVFMSCTGLTSVTIPDSVTSISNSVFWNCTSLTSVAIPDGVTSIAYGTFAYCTGLTSVTIPDSVTSIGEYAFQNCTGLTSVTLPEGYISIGADAFSSTPVSYLAGTIYTDANGVQYQVMGGKAFVLYCPDGKSPRTDIPPKSGSANYPVISDYTLITSGTNNNIIWRIIEIDGEQTLVLSGTGEMGGYYYASNAPWYDYRSSIKYLEIEDGITSIGLNAFCEFSSLTSVTIPSSVTSIGNYAFNYCTGLIDLTIGDGVTSIGECAFQNCIGLTSVTIPGSVTSIGNNAFYNCSGLTSVTIPDSVTSIGNYAFAYCSGLTNLTIGEGITSIGGYVFWSCTGLTSVTIPESVTSIGDSAFARCSGLTDLTIGEGVTSIGNSAFYSCSSLTSVTIPDSVISIGSYAFAYCSGTTDVSIGNSVTSIGADAFYNCSGLTSVTIPDSVTSIGTYAFYNCSSLTSVSIPKDASVDSYAFQNCTGLTTVELPDGYFTLAASAFSGCTNVAPLNTLPGGTYFVDENGVYYALAADSAYVVYCPEGVTTLLSALPSKDGTVEDAYPVVSDSTYVAGGVDGDISWVITEKDSVQTLTLSGSGSMNNYGTTGMPWYSYRTTIKNVVIKEGITSIGNQAFYNHTGLTSVTIPEGVTGIGLSVFRGCTGLTTITIPEGVTTIGSYAFQNCTKLTAVTIPSSVTTMDYVFYGCSGLTSVTFTEGLAGIGNYAFQNCTGLTSVEIPSTVTSIGNYAFSGCTGLTSVTIPSSVTTMDYVFYGCSGLTSVTFTEGLAGIGNYAFQNCTGLTSVEIPSTVTSIGNYAFSGCTGLTSVTIPEGVTTIGNYAFQNCTKLTAVTIPSTVTTMDYAFSGNTSLTSVTFTEGLTGISDYAFRNCTGLTSVTISGSVESVGNYAFYGCSGLTSVTFSEGLTRIGSCTFAGCTSLTDVTIPEGVAHIGFAAFQNCTALTTVTIPENITVGYNAFQNCTSLTTVNFPNGYFKLSTFPFSGCTSLTALNGLDAGTYYSAENKVLYALLDGKGYVVYCPEDVTELLEYLPSEDGTNAEAYPVVSDSIYVAGGVSGNITWRISEKNGERTLTLTGTGVMDDYFYDDLDYVSSIPWENYRGTIKYVEIGKGITSIGNYAFYCCTSLTSVTIPDSVTSIGDYAFYGCTGLTAVTIPENVTTIGDSAFCSCTGLTSVTIPESVTYIGSYAFSGCTSLISVTIPESVTTIGSGAFSGCTGLTAVSIPESVTTIGSSAFSGCTSLTSVTIPEKVTIIEQYTFSGCSGLTSVIIPEGVTTIDRRAFSGCTGLTSVTIPGTVTSMYQTFQFCTGLTSVTICEGATSIGAGTFIGCTGLTSVVIPGTVTSIDSSAFSGCTGLTSVTIAEGVTSIGNYAFQNCTGLTSVTIPSTVTTMDYAFVGCTGLADVTITDGVTNIGMSAFSGCTSLTSVTIPASVTTIGNYAFQNCIGLTSVEIPEGVTGINDYAFYGCTGLESVTIPGSVSAIGRSAFFNCTSLTDLTISEGVISIGMYAFQNCTGLTSVEIPGSVTSISDYAFQNCTGLTNATIPEGVTYIGMYAFQNCTGLTNATIPEGVTYIGMYAFQNCTGLTTVTLSDGINSIGSGAFSNCTGLTSVEIPEGVISIGNSAFSGCTSLESVTIPDSVTSIDPWAFSSCTSLTSVTIPEGVTSLGDYVFSSCTGLTSVTIPSTVTNFGYYPFNGCSGLASVTLPEGYMSIPSTVFASTPVSYLSGTIYTDENGVQYQVVNGTAYVVYCPEGIEYKSQILNEEGTDFYPVIYGKPIAQGTSGNIAWIIIETNEERTLFLSGSGPMNDYGTKSYIRAPWYSYSSTINHIEIGEGITSIGNYAFYYCSSVTDVTIPGSVTSMGNYAFYNCDALIDVTLSEGVTGIGTYAFSDCDALTSVTIPGSVTSMGTHAFSDCDALASVTISEGVTSISSYVFYNCDALTSIILPVSVTSIDTYAFYDCDALTSVTIPSVISIGSYAFQDCDALTSVVIPNSVTSIGYRAFYSCDSLTSVTLPNSITSFGGSEFAYCSNLTSVTLSERYATIPSSMFSSTPVSSLSGIVHVDTNGVAYQIFGEKAYVLYCPDDDTEPQSKILNETETGYYPVVTDYSVITSGTSGNITWRIIEIDGERHLVLDGTGAMADYSYYSYTPWYSYRTTIKHVEIANGITGIGQYAFYGFTGLTSVDIPDSITSIGYDAFYGCSGLTQVSFPEGSFTIDSYAFGSCTNLTQLSSLSAGTYCGDENGALYCVISGVAYYLYSPMSGYIAPQSITVETEEGTVGYLVYSTNLPVKYGNSNGMWWFLHGSSGNYTLRVTGDAAIPDYSSKGAPWYSYAGEITTLDLGDNITGIGNYAFADCSQLSSVKIPKNVTYISYLAFNGCSNLGTFAVDSENTAYTAVRGILYNAAETQLVRCPPKKTSVKNIPDTVTAIGAYAFYNNSAMTKIVLPDGLTAIGEYAFYNCDGLTELELPDGVTEVGNYAFANSSGLTTVNIPESLDTIPAYAFSGCTNLSEVDMTARYINLGANAFANCSSVGPLASANSGLHYVDEQGAVYWICNEIAYFIGSPADIVDYEILTKTPAIGDLGPYPVASDVPFVDYGTDGDISWYIVDENDSRTLVICGKGEMPAYTSGSAPWYAYRGTVDELNVRDGVTNISSYAFYNFTDLDFMALPASVTSIDSYAFQNCSSLDTAYIPEGVQSIGSYAFKDCSGLTSVKIPGTAMQMDYAFYNCDGITSVTLSEGLTSIGESVFYDCDGLTSVTIPDSVTSIGSSAFYSCGSLTDVTIGSGVTEIGSSAFAYAGLTHVTIPDSVTSIGDYAFQYCAGLTDVSIGSGVTSIGISAFSGCTGLTEVTIGSSVTNIGNYAFSGCSALTDVVIPESVATIGDYAFQSCTSLTDVTIGNGVTSIGSSAFSGCTKLASVVIPDSVTTIRTYAFVSCTSLTDVTIGNGVTSIGGYTFSGCTTLTSVELPQKYITVSTTAFQSTPVSYLTGTIYTDANGVQYRIYNSQAYVVYCPDENTDIPDTIPRQTSGTYPVVKDGTITTTTVIGSGTSYGISWRVVDTNGVQTLYLSGSGTMYNYHPSYAKTPWSAYCVGYGYPYSYLIDHIVIGSGITSIGDYAFYNLSNAVYVLIPDSVTSIGNYAFRNCWSLTSVTIPDNVTSIGLYAFQSCTSLTDVTIGSGVTSIDDYAFTGCSALTSVTLPQGYITIPTTAFQSTPVSYLNGTIYADANGVQYRIFGSKAYVVYRPAEDTEIPDTIPNEDDSGTYPVVKDAAVIASGTDTYGTSWYIEEVNGEQTLYVYGSGAMYSGYNPGHPTPPWYGYRATIDHIVVDSGITSVGNYAFYGLYNAADVVLPDGITTIGNCAFSGCSNLSGITIPESVTSIGNSAFSGCSNLSGVTIPESVTSIGSSVFSGCSNLETIVVEAGNTAYTTVDGILYNADVTELICCPAKRVSPVTIPDSVTSIANSAFNGCTGLTSITIPGSVTSIGSGAFSGCTGLTGVTIPDSITSISSSAFSGCTGLTSVTIPYGVISIESSAFRDCSGLTSVIIPDSVTTIGNYAFFGCSALASVKLPQGYMTISATVFQSTPVSYLNGTTYTDANGVQYRIIDSKAYVVYRPAEDTYIPDTIPNEDDSGTYSVVKDATVIASGISGGITWYIEEASGEQMLYLSGSGAMSNYSSTGMPWYGYRSTIDHIVIGNGITSIGNYAFYNVTSVVDVVIPDSVTSLGDYVFADCTELTNITLDSSALSTVSTSAFQNCGQVQHVTIGTNVDTLYPALFTRVKVAAGSYPDISFAGENWFTVSSNFFDTSNEAMPLSLLEAGGSYYVDAQGALYRIEDGAATLLYVPAGVTEYTVPAVIPAEEEGADGYTVTGVGSHAISEAKDLTTLTFAAPENILILEDFALANCPTLTSVNEKESSSEILALFPNATIGNLVFFNSGVEDTLEGTSGAIEVKSDSGIHVIVNTRADDDGDYTFYTGEAATTLISLANTVEGSTDKVRVYFSFSDDDATFGFELRDYTFEGDKTGNLYTVVSGKIEGMSIYYLELPAIDPADTVNIEITNLYKCVAPYTDGGELTIWAELLSGDGSGTGSVMDVCHQLNWITEPNSFQVAKRQSGSAELYADGTENGDVTVNSLQYAIKLTTTGSRTAPANLGKDHATGVDFTDVITLPEGMSWNEDVLEAVRSGNWYYKTSGSYPRYTVTFWRYAEGPAVQICQVNNVSTYGKWSLSVAEDGNLCVSWGYTNTNYTNAEMTFPETTLKFESGVIMTDERPEPGDTFDITNNVNAVVHYSYSGDKTSDVSCTDTVTANEASLILDKTNDRSGTPYYGESYPYTITARNYGVQNLQYLDSIEDPLDQDLYITAEDMETMFYEDYGGENLQITIDDATIYKQLNRSTVTAVNGTEYDLSIQNTSFETWYHGPEYEEVENCIISTGKTLTIGWNEAGQLAVTVDATETVVTGSLQDALEAVGYFVTPLAQYTVKWDFNNSQPVWSGEIQTYKIRSTIKDAFMTISYDHLIGATWEADTLVDSFPLAANHAVAYYSHASVSKDPIYSDDADSNRVDAVRWDFRVSTAIYQNGVHVEQDDIIEAGGVLEHRVSVLHQGTASYDIVPLVDHVQGAEILMVNAAQNPHLGEQYGLKMQTIGGIDYYLLDTVGTYENVYVGGYLAEKVVVSPYGDNCLHTLIYWYFTDIDSTERRDLSFKVLAVPVGDFSDTTTFEVNNEVWLNDHQTHRLWSEEGSHVAFFTFDKKIVTERNTAYPEKDAITDYSVIDSGMSVTYRLRLNGMLSEDSVQIGRTITVPGRKVYDALPLSIDEYRWTKDNVKLEFAYDDSKVDVVGETGWTIEDSDDPDEPDQQNIVWDDVFSITYYETASVYIYVTLTYPEGENWITYCRNYGDDRLVNTLYVADDSSRVYHALKQPAQAVLVKGVESTGIVAVSKENNDKLTYYPSSDRNSRFNYANDDGWKRAVTYYIAIYNDGNTRLYLNDIQDKLPEGFSLCTNVEPKILTSHNLAYVDDADNLDYVYRDAKVDVSETNGYLTFTISETGSNSSVGYDDYFDKCYLLPQEVLVFGYRCYTNGYDGKTAISDNTAAMPYFDYNTEGVVLGNSTITGTNAYATDKNDGTCTMMDNSTAELKGFTGGNEYTQWLASSVRVTRGNIVPGITKSVSSVTDTTTGNVTWSLPQAKFNDIVTWNVTATNSGTLPISNYTLVDVMQRTYNMTGAVTYTIDSGAYYGTEAPERSAVLFNIEDLPTDGTSKSYTSTVFGDFVVTYKTCVADTETEVGEDAILSIQFLSDKAAIPEGGQATLTVSTKNEGTLKNYTYTNTSYIIPMRQNWEESAVTQGKQVTYDDKPAVQSSAQVTVASSFLTTSIKSVEEKQNTDNYANSIMTENAIVLPGKDSIFTYTLSVTNSGGVDQVMDKLVFIDSLPQVDDHNVLVNTDMRFSEFTVSLADDPNFVVTLIEKGGAEKEITDYRLEYSTKTEFTDADWDGSADGWNATAADARSFRIVIDGSETEKIPEGATVTVSFDAKISGGALPGEVAWNSFGYHYEINLNDSLVKLEAAPLKVGVKLPSVPVLVKRIQTPDGVPYQAEKDEVFTYLIFENGETALNLEGLTTEQIAAALKEANVTNFTCVSLTVPAGATESAEVILTDQKIWEVTDSGELAPKDTAWDWDDGTSYTFLELPIENSEDYVFGTLAGNHRNSYSYVYDSAAKRTIISENLRRVWNISLLKVADNEGQTHLPGAWFGLYSLVEPVEDVTKPDGLTEDMPARLDYEEKTYYLTDVQMSGTDGMVIWKNLTETEYLLKELQAPAGYNHNDELYLIQRPSELYFNTAEIVVVNRSGFEMPKSGGIGTAAYTMLGITAMFGSGGLLLAEKKRKKKKSE